MNLAAQLSLQHEVWMLKQYKNNQRGLKGRKWKNLWTSLVNGQWQVIPEPRKPLQTKLCLSSLTKRSHWRIWGQGWKVLYTVWRVKTVERTVHTFSLMVYFLTTLEAAVPLLLSWEDLPNRPKRFPRPLYNRRTIQPLSTCFPVSLDLSLHLFVSHPPDL